MAPELLKEYYRYRLAKATWQGRYWPGVRWRLLAQRICNLVSSIHRHERRQKQPLHDPSGLDHCMTQLFAEKGVDGFIAQIEVGDLFR